MTEEIRESTVNSHERPMRYDLDDLVAAVASLHGTVAKVESSVQDLKGQLQALGEQEDDRAARRAVDRGSRRGWRSRSASRGCGTRTTCPDRAAHLEHDNGPIPSERDGAASVVVRSAAQVDAVDPTGSDVTDLVALAPGDAVLDGPPGLIPLVAREEKADSG